MSAGPKLIFQGTLLGSMLVVLLGGMVTSNVKAENLPEAASIELPGAETTPEEARALETQDPQDLFEASIAFTPETGDAGPPAPENENQSIECRVSDKFPPSILQWCDYITRYAEQHELPPDFIAAVMVQESGGKPLAYSKSGAVGLMQVMPKDGIAANFVCKNGPCFTNRPTIEELQDPDFNVAYGTRMLAGLFGKFGNLRDALKSYGPMNVGYSYADKVLAIYERYGQ